jgi:uncharacterized membrane protein YozB (DUF420 family)
MSISAIAPLSQAAFVRRHDRIFYSTVAVALALTVVAGFGPTYYFRIIGASPLTTLSGGPVTVLVHVHAIVFTAWALLFIVQTALIAQHKVAVHRRVGLAGAVLAVLMVVTGAWAALHQAARGVAPPGLDPHQFLMIPLSDMLLFGGFVAAALLRRTNKEAHKRLMLLAYVCIVVAAIARLPGVLPLGAPAFFGLSLLFVLAGVIYDRVSRGRVHPVYVWGGTMLALSVPLRLLISGTDMWRQVAQWLVGYVRG